MTVQEEPIEKLLWKTADKLRKKYRRDGILAYCVGAK